MKVLVDRAALPHADVLPIGLDGHLKTRESMLRHRLNPFDTIHLTAMRIHGLQTIAGEDADFDRAEGEGAMGKALTSRHPRGES